MHADQVAKENLTAEPEKPIAVRYSGEIVGEFSANILVEGLVIVELKSGMSRRMLNLG